MWQWSASKPDLKLCLIEMIVHLFHHLPQTLSLCLSVSCTHPHTCTHYFKPAPTCCDHYFKELANRMTSFRVASDFCMSVLVIVCVCVQVCVRAPDWLISVKSLKKHVTIQNEELINQPVPELALSLSAPLPCLLIPAFISPSPHPTISPPTLQRGGWGSSDAVTPGFPLSFCYIRSAVCSFISHWLQFFRFSSLRE